MLLTMLGRRVTVPLPASTLEEDRREHERVQREIDSALAVARAQVMAYQHRRRGAP